jgi:S-(hydroxymethyl)glutathione dehydrogenase/alcohol dehydrogenase
MPEQLLVHENGAVAIDPDMPFDRAALMGCAVVTGAGAVLNTAAVKAGEHVAVIGCGGIGLAAINAARIAGAARIIAIDPVPAKRALAENSARPTASIRAPSGCASRWSS